MRVSNRHIPGRVLAPRSGLSAFSALLIGSVWAVSGLAQAQQEVLIDAGPCLQFETSVERLVCFEEQAKAAAGNTSAASQGDRPVLRIDRSNQQLPPARSAAVPAAAPAAATQSGNATSANSSGAATAAAAAPRQDAEASFGLPQRVDREEQTRNELRGTIESFREISPNQYLITLTNGQVWRQMHSDRYNIREGHAVRIYPTRWGSAYRLTVEELKGFIQVERVK